MFGNEIANVASFRQCSLWPKTSSLQDLPDVSRDCFVQRVQSTHTDLDTSNHCRCWAIIVLVGLEFLCKIPLNMILC